MAVRDRIALFKGYQAKNEAAALISMSRIYAYEATSEPAGIKDLNHRYIYANEAYRRLLNLSLDYDVSGKTFEEMTGLSNEFSDNIRKHEELVVSDKMASFAREYFISGSIKRQVPHFFFRIPYFSNNADVLAIEFFAVSWYKFTNMHHQTLYGTEKEHDALTPYSILTDKQWAAFYLYCTGLTAKDIASILGISLSGVRKRIERSIEIMINHLHLDTNSEIITEIIKLGWLNFTPIDLLADFQQVTLFHLPR